MKNLKILVAMVLVVLMLGTSAVAFADYPEKAIEVLIPAGPGGDTDTTVRAITASLTELLGQPVVVTNMPGGAGTVAMTELQNRDADGYTVFYHHVDTLLLEILRGGQVIVCLSYTGAQCHSGSASCYQKKTFKTHISLHKDTVPQV